MSTTNGSEPDGIREQLARSGGEPDDASVLELITSVMGKADRIAFNRTEAADRLGVSVEFFDEHIAGEVYRVRRGRRTLYPLSSLLWWIWQNVEPRDHDGHGSGERD